MGLTQGLVVMRRIVVFVLVYGEFRFPCFPLDGVTEFCSRFHGGSAGFGYCSFHRLKIDVPNSSSHPSPFATSDLGCWFVGDPSDYIFSRVLCSSDNQDDMQ
ncbi:hypothetical protein V6N13_139573 [Hibiscus sabdariffa]